MFLKVHTILNTYKKQYKNSFHSWKAEMYLIFIGS